MRKIIAALIALCVLTLPLLALADTPRTITVTGTATFTTEPDSAILSLGVQTTGREASDAAAANARAMTALTAALLEAGIEENDITTAYYFVNTVYDYDTMGEDGSMAILGYTVSNRLSVTVKDIDRVGDIIDIALSSGANSCDGISFRSSQGESLNDLALSAAVEEAIRKAAIVARAAGGTVGQILSVTEQPGSYSGAMYARSAGEAEETASSADYGTQIHSDGLDYSATVVVVFELIGE